MKNIICDIDGVVANYDFSYLTQKYFGVDIPNSRVNAYSIEDCLGVSTEQVSNMFKVECFAPPNLIPGAIDTLKYWLAKDYNVYILTNRLRFMNMIELVAWLSEAGIPYSAVVTMDNLPSYNHAQIDDSPTKLLSVYGNVTVKHPILFRQPWNKKCLNLTGVLEIAKNWKEVKDLVNEQR